jgi:hypothetical protein
MSSAKAHGGRRSWRTAHWPPRLQNGTKLPPLHPGAIWMDVRKVYPSADLVGPYTVFNTKGNAYRLIVKIEYRWQMIFVKHLLTHAEYDRKEWTK